MWWVELVVSLWLFAVGCVVGSFLNVCIYRIPWQKSVIWPGSHCPKCLAPIAARDNIPVVSWLILRASCRRCGSGIAARYPLIEALAGLLFVAVYLIDTHSGGAPWYTGNPYATVAYHLLFVSLLVVATFIDYDLYVLPDAVTVTGMVLGIGLGALFPEVRLDPLSLPPTPVKTHSAGLVMGVQGLLVGGGLVWTIGFVFSRVFRREAMGFGDVTLNAMIGAFLGWQAAVLAFFLAPFFGLAHASWKGAKAIAKKIRGDKLSGSDHEIPFGPYLSMAAVGLVLGWPWVWWMWAMPLFKTLRVVFWLILGYDT
jgi:leader peptidase (prepilin peptidase) / N-methyltransferase